MEVEIRGERGTVISVGSGRVIVDFNHPLAGRDLVFKVKLVKVIKSDEEKVRALFADRLALSDANLSYENGIVTISLPFLRLFSSETLQALDRFARDVERYVSEVKAVRLISPIFERKVEGAPTERGSETP